MLDVLAVQVRTVSGLVGLLLLAGTLLGPSQALADANDTMAGADGPILSGVTWNGAISTENDVDWFVFYTGASTENDIALMSTSPDSCFGQVTQLTDANGRFLAGYGYPINHNETGHIRYTVGPGTFYVEVSPYNVAPCIGPSATYRLWINSSPALLSGPPYVPPPAPPSSGSGSHGSTGQGSYAAACGRARGRVDAITAHLRSANTRRERQRWRAKLRRARSEVRTYC